jgi:RNA polymerase sigma-70 factor (ECF subfamily)
MQVMDAQGLASLVDAHAAALVLYARQWCASPDDVVQEALIRLAGQRPPPANPVAWLYTTVRRCALDAARAERRRKRHEGGAARGPDWFAPGPETGLDAEAAARALESLPGEQREVIVAHLWGGLTFEQVGALAGCSASTAHRRYLAALSSLRERLGVPCPNQRPT